MSFERQDKFIEKETKHNALEKKQFIIEEFRKRLENISAPHAFLVYGSVGRGKCRKDSDIDTMLVFNDEDTKEFIDDDFLKSLPFDGEGGSADHIIENLDIKDLSEQKIDFLRIKGKSNGEVLELQLFPFSSVKKATTISGEDLVGGTKRLDEKFVIKDNDPRPTITFTGKVVNFLKNPRLASSGRRIDINEAGIKNSPDGWIRGLTAGKLIAPKIIEDTMDFSDFLDNKILRRFIKSILYNFGYYVYDKDGRVTGIKKEALDYRIINKLLINHKQEDRSGQVYEFGEVEEVTFKKRFDEQMARIIEDNGYKII
jgi:predicted nucleotidyltransferase